MKDFGKLIRAVTANVNQHISTQVEEYGIRQGQLDYFLIIYSSPGINHLELARLKSVGKASVTKALQILEEDGFIVREADLKDKRNALCFITDKGKGIVDDLLHVKISAEEKLFHGFSAQDKLVLHKLLTLMHQNSESLATDNDSRFEEE